MAPATAFYCVADERYFLGAVALVNSLRVLGHAEPVFVCDCGLTPAQRAHLEPEATLVPEPSGVPPWLLKTVAPLQHPADVMVLIDADIIITRSLGDLIEKARAGDVVAVEHGSERFFGEWAELLDLGTMRPRPYVSSALVALPRSPGERVLELMQDRREVVDFERTFWRDNVAEYPFLYADQDLLNAVLAAEVEPDRVQLIDRRLEALIPFEGLRVLDAESLRCAYEDGVEPYAVHHVLPVKPWLEPTTPGVYSQLLLRLLHGGDVAVRVPDGELPPHLRRGALGRARRWRLRGGRR